jgi:hypothetical protein
MPGLCCRNRQNAATGKRRESRRFTDFREDALCNISKSALCIAAGWRVRIVTKPVRTHLTVSGFWEVHSSALVGRSCDYQKPKTAIIWDAGIMSSRPATIETPGAIATTASSSMIGPKERLCRRPISQPRVKRSCRCLVVQPLQQDRGRHKHPFIGGHCRLQLVGARWDPVRRGQDILGGARSTQPTLRGSEPTQK